MDETIARQHKRFTFLSALYDATDANIHALVDLAGFCEQLGITPREGWEILSTYLVPKQLAKHGGGGGKSGWTSITLDGVEAVEGARTNPMAPTHHFAPLVQINVAHMAQSIIQTGAGSTATISQQIRPEDQTRLLEAIKQIRRTLEGKGNETAELIELVIEVEAEARKPKPNRFKLWPSLQTIAISIQTMADLGPAYSTLRGLLKAAGIDLPPGHSARSGATLAARYGPTRKGREGAVETPEADRITLRSPRPASPPTSRSERGSSHSRRNGAAGRARPSGRTTPASHECPSVPAALTHQRVPARVGAVCSGAACRG